jgi:hypothetical protein
MDAAYRRELCHAADLITSNYPAVMVVAETYPSSQYWQSAGAEAAAPTDVTASTMATLVAVLA